MKMKKMLPGTSKFFLCRSATGTHLKANWTRLARNNMKTIQTRMHSSRMRTIRGSVRLEGYLPGFVSAGGVSAYRGAQAGVSLGVFA